jgi:hypothetical protein
MARRAGVTDQEKLQELWDRHAILSVVHRYARGLDRHDDDILRSCFHPDALDHHGRWKGGREAFVQWANHECHNDLHAHMHNITSHNCELDGAVAHAESYVMFVHRVKDDKTVNVGGGRYVDRFEKRDGEWKISRRRLIMDYRFTADGSKFSDFDSYEKGTWDKTDASYQRPLRIPGLDDS